MQQRNCFGRYTDAPKLLDKPLSSIEKRHRCPPRGSFFFFFFFLIQQFEVITRAYSYFVSAFRNAKGCRNPMNYFLEHISRETLRSCPVVLTKSNI